MHVLKRISIKVKLITLKNKLIKYKFVYWNSDVNVNNLHDIEKLIVCFFDYSLLVYLIYSIRVCSREITIHIILYTSSYLS